MFLLAISPEFAEAQRWSVSDKIWQMGCKSMVYIESIQKSPGIPRTVIDTVSGTGFLVADKGGVYLITTRENLQNNGFNEIRNLTDSIYISASPDGRGEEFI